MAFFDKWSHNPLVIDKWFMLQGTRKTFEGIEHLTKLTEHKVYDRRNPNRVRSLLGGFTQSNPRLFHHHSGEGYRFLASQILDMDSRNPQVAARILGVFENWTKLDASRQKRIKTTIEGVIAAKPSKNVLEIAQKIIN